MTNANRERSCFRFQPAHNLNTKRIIPAVASAAILFVASIASAQGTPEDVARIKKAYTVMSTAGAGEDATNRVVKELTELATQECDKVLEENHLVDAVSSKLIDLRMLVKREVRTAVAGAGGGEKAPEYAAAMELLRRFSARQTAEDLIASWFGITTPVTRENSGIFYDPNCSPTPPVPGVPPKLKSQISVPPSDGPLIIGDESAITEEVGGAGAGNGVLDGGEWVKIGFRLKNTSELPIFSTSAWVEPDSSCLWSDSSLEVELGEMPAKIGEATLFAWVYLSNSCTDAGARTLRIQVRDTRQSVQTFNVGLNVRDRIGSEPTETLLDTDLPGSSDGTNLSTLAPGTRFELSSAIKVTSTAAVSANMLYAIAPDTRGLFSEIGYRHLDMATSALGQFRPSDDIDAVVVDLEAFKAAVRGLNVSKDWYDEKDGGALWVVLDSRVFLPSPNPQVRPEGQQERERRRDERKAEKTAEKKAEKKVEKKPEKRRLELSDAPMIVEMLKRHVGLVARPAEPRIDGALDATDGHEVVFDEAGFLEEYNKLTALPPEAPIVKPTTNALTEYRFRNFYRLALPPVVSVDRAETVKKPEKVKAKTAAQVDDSDKKKPNKKVKKRWFRLDAGFGGGVYQTTNQENWARWEWKNDVPPVFDALISVGPSWSGVISLTHAWRSDSAINFHETGILGGLSYVVNSGGIVEWQPRLALGFQYRTAEDSAGKITDASFAFLIGSMLRLMPASHFGFYSDLSYVFAFAGPDVNGDQAVMRGSVFHFAFGITLRF